MVDSIDHARLYYKFGAMSLFLDSAQLLQVLVSSLALFSKRLTHHVIFSALIYKDFGPRIVTQLNLFTYEIIAPTILSHTTADKNLNEMRKPSLKIKDSYSRGEKLSILF